MTTKSLLTDENRALLLQIVTSEEDVDVFWVDRYDDHYRYAQRYYKIDRFTGKFSRLDEDDNPTDIPVDNSMIVTADRQLIRLARKLMQKVEPVLDRCPK